MPSRRTFLTGSATAVVAATAGCLGGVDDLLGGDGTPSYASWLHDPGTVLDVDRYAVATVDVAAVRRHRETLPETTRDVLDRAEALSESVSLSDVSRLTALGYGGPQAGRAGLTLTAEGQFDAADVRAETGVDDSHLVTDAGTHEGYTLYEYAPRVFADLREFQGPEQSSPPDLTFGLGASDAALVGGVVLSPTARGLGAVRAAIDAHEGTTDGLSTARATTDLLAVVGDRDVVTTLSRATVTDLATQVDDEDTRSLLEDADGLGVGYALADETLRVALAADPAELASPDRVRSVLDDATDDVDEPDGPTVEQVGVARGGRVVYADLALPLESVVAAGSNVSVTEPFGTPVG